MPIITKKALSQFIRTNCLRRLRLDLTPDNKKYQQEREAANMPPKQNPRPGLEHLAGEGRKWEAEKVGDLARTFGLDRVIGAHFTTPSGQTRYNQSELSALISGASEGTFLIEAEFDFGNSFKSALKISDYESSFSLVYGRLRPDIIEVLPHIYDRYIQSDGQQLNLPAGDTRLQLRVIDIKLTSEPSPSYFAEVTYYSMALAGWIIDNGLENQFVVVPNAAVWPGSHSRSNLDLTCHRIQVEEEREPTYRELWDALQIDLEIVPYDVFAPRVRHFFQKDLRRVLSCVDWQKLDWHVDNRCKGCDFLGYYWYEMGGNPTWHPLHCIPTAEKTNHLSRIASISRGVKTSLNDNGILDVQSLANLNPDDVAYGHHQLLKSKRYVFNGRANSLLSNQVIIPEQSGTSAIMPRWADLRIYITVDFDIGSAITFSMGVKALWVEPIQQVVTHRENHSFPSRSFTVENKDLETESKTLVDFLTYINEILLWVETKDEERKNNNNGKRTKKSTLQVYIWDPVRYNHLVRIIGRHLHEILDNKNISHLAWLFPPEEVLPNHDMSSIRSPITIVKDVIQSVLAVPIPHYYSLFSVARNYHDKSLSEYTARFGVPPLYEDPLSDLIPSERAHDIWTRSPNWSDRHAELVRTVRDQLTALETVTKRLESDLGSVLKNNAAPLKVDRPKRVPNLNSFDGQLWCLYAQLDVALNKLEIFQNRAMPVHEREARFFSARLIRRLTGSKEEDALANLRLPRDPNRRVYLLNENSRDVKVREGDFHFALAPEEHLGFLDQKYKSFVQGTDLDSDDLGWERRMEDVTQVTVRAIDREAGLIVLDANPDRTKLDDLEKLKLADFSENVILDPIFKEYFEKKLGKTLLKIGNPDIATVNPIVQRAVGLKKPKKGKKSELTPPARFLWSAQELVESRVVRELDQVQGELEDLGVILNNPQWDAWKEALSHRLHLIWGPPGTGKSLTLRSIVLGAIINAHLKREPLRILITAGTYNAMDNVLLGIFSESTTQEYLLNIQNFHAYRVRSSYKSISEPLPVPLEDIELDKYAPSQNLKEMLQNLKNNNTITLVGAPPQQVHNLLILDDQSPVQSLFDLIILDEASQMDVGNAILSISAITDQGSLIVAGDPLQLPPIHKAKPPRGLENMVGSIYKFYNGIYDIDPSVLQINYRSNSTIVNFTHEAGYERSLTSNSPDLRLNFIKKIPSGDYPPSGWPEWLFWTPNWSVILDPNHPLTCFIYPDGRSGQSNQFEADAIASLVYLLNGRMGQQLCNERDPRSDEYIKSDDTVMDDDWFWKMGVGIVTPHKAQQALIINCLQRIFPNISPDLIRGAVDTVERFQGQQRDVIIASFALGDEDAISDEDEFILGLNRFNVMASRPRAKLITFLSEELVF